MMNDDGDGDRDGDVDTEDGLVNPISTHLRRCLSDTNLYSFS